jgi:DNA-binding PucR family transcriptional regulator
LLRLVEAALVGIPHAIGTAGDEELLVLAQSSDASGASTPDDVDERIDRLSERAELGALVVGRGSARPGVEGVRRSRSEALIAYRVARRTGTEGLLRFENLGVERMLAQIPPSDEVRDYVASTIGPLEDDPELLATLQTFLEQGGNKVATAARIPLHRSSLMYRLNKISDKLGVDVNDPERRLELWLALRLRRMLGVVREPGGE